MHLDHEFTVPVPAAHAWPVLLDVERVGPCLPGATVTKVEGRDFQGKVRVKVGPITVTYLGQASFTDVDDEQHRVVILAKGKEARGSGTANATITAQLHDEGDATRVTVHTDLAVTGRPAQFGRGVLAEVGAKLLGRFADCLAGQLATGETAEAPGQAPQAAGPASLAPAEPAPAEAPPPTAGAVDAPSGTAQEPTAPPATRPTPGPAAAEAPPPATGAVGAPSGAAPAAATPAESAGPAAEATPPSPKQTGPTPVGPTPRTGQPAYPREGEAIDLLEAAGGPILKRLAPVLAALVLLALLLAVLRRRDR